MSVEKAWPHPPVYAATLAEKILAFREEQSERKGHERTGHIGDVDMNGIEALCDGRLERSLRY